MNIANPPPAYDHRDQAAFREAVRQADQDNQKRSADIRLDGGQRIIIQDEDTGDLYRLKVASGSLSIEAFTG